MKASLQFFLGSLIFHVVSVGLAIPAVVVGLQETNLPLFVAAIVVALVSCALLYVAVAKEWVPQGSLSNREKLLQPGILLLVSSVVSLLIAVVLGVLSVIMRFTVLSIIPFVFYILSYLLSTGALHRIINNKRKQLRQRRDLELGAAGTAKVADVIAEEVVAEEMIDTALDRLYRLRQANATTEEEFRAAKRMLLGTQEEDPRYRGSVSKEEAITRASPYARLNQQMATLLKHPAKIEKQMQEIREKEESAATDKERSDLQNRLDDLQDKYDDVSRRLRNLLLSKEAVGDSSGGNDGDDTTAGKDMQWMHATKMGKTPAVGSFNSQTDMLLEGLDPDQVESLLFGGEDDGETFRIEDLENDPMLAQGDRKGSVLSHTQRASLTSRGSFSLRASGEYKFQFDSQFLETYYRNERFRMQCFPFCKEFGDYAVMKAKGASHEKHLKGCSGIVQAHMTVPLHMKTPTKSLLILGRIKDVKVKENDLVLPSRLVSKHMIDSLISHGHFVQGIFGMCAREKRSTVVPVEFLPVKNSWNFRGKLENRGAKKGKKKKKNSDVQQFVFDVLIFCAEHEIRRISMDRELGHQLQHTFSRGSSFGGEQYMLLLRSQSSPFHITTTRKLNRKKGAK